MMQYDWRTANISSKHNKNCELVYHSTEGMFLEQVLQNRAIGEKEILPVLVVLSKITSNFEEIFVY